MSYLRGPNRSQVQLLPECLDDYVAPNAPVRFIDAYVEGLNFQALGLTHAETKSTGRPPYHPADLLKLYLYGYLYRIRSSRRLEAEAGRNLELIWLLRSLRPDFKTIADFRRDNRAAFKNLFQQFNLLCRHLGLFGAELVAIDGSKFKAVNNSRRYCTQEQLAEMLEKIQTRIDEYLQDLDRQDTEAEGVAGAPNREQLAEKIKQLKETKGDYNKLLTTLQTNDVKSVALTDPDSRKVKGPNGFMIGYNVQLAVDAKHALIVAEEVVQASNDCEQLSAMALKAKEALQAERLQIVADVGYHATAQLESCEQAGVEAFVPEPNGPKGRSKGGKKIFPKEQFRYDARIDVYHCPGGKQLRRMQADKSRDRVLYYHRNACAMCLMKHQCTSRAYRVIGRRDSEAVAERAAARVLAHPELIAQRRAIVEHVFGSLRQWGHDTFLMRGLEKVRAEFSLSALTYNLRRVLNIFTTEKLLALV
jgi:transposase